MVDELNLHSDTPRGGGYSPFSILTIKSPMLLSSKGMVAVSIEYSMTPRLHTSHSGPLYGLSRRISGEE